MFSIYPCGFIWVSFQIKHSLWRHKAWENCPPPLCALFLTLLYSLHIFDQHFLVYFLEFFLFYLVVILVDTEDILWIINIVVLICEINCLKDCAHSGNVHYYSTFTILFNAHSLQVSPYKTRIGAYKAIYQYYLLRKFFN